MVVKKKKLFGGGIQLGESIVNEKINPDEKFEYIQLKLPVDEFIETYKEFLKNRIDGNYTRPKIYEAMREDIPTLVYLYNHAFMTSGVPFRKMNEEMFQILFEFPECTILIAQLYGNPVGFIVIDYEGPQKQYGVITALGILHRYQKKGIASALAYAAWTGYFKDKTEEIRCEVFYTNESSLSFVRSIGFKAFDKRE